MDAQATSAPRVSADPRALHKAHAYAREHGVSRPLYALARALLTPPLRLWVRLHVKGADQIPAEGAVIVAPNHKSFLDAFFVGLGIRRHVRFMAKVELFKGPLGRLFPRLGAFPVRRGEADAEALETARVILEGGGVVVVFPEGTRVDEEGCLASPHHGAARLALDTRTPILPAAIGGTSHLWLGPILKPRRVEVAFLPRIEVGDLEPTEEAARKLMDGLVWPAVRTEYGRLLSRPGLVAATLAALGLSGGLLARRQQRKAAEPQLIGKLGPRRLRRRRRRRELLGRLSPRRKT